jgi:hypothetical protein
MRHRAAVINDLPLELAVPWIMIDLGEYWDFFTMGYLVFEKGNNHRGTETTEVGKREG